VKRYEMPAEVMKEGIDTNALVAAYAQDADLDRETLDVAIPASIDALYTARDAGRHMHEAGAAAAVAAIRAMK
jgi:hypothetical protein